MTNKTLRKWVYIEKPQKFEISGCSCGNDDCEWSEYEGYLWCSKCNIDFIPDFNGVFDGPIPINLANMLGLSFAKIHIPSGKVFVLDFDKSYTMLLEPSNFYPEVRTPLVFRNKFNPVETNIVEVSIINGKLAFHSDSIRLSDGAHYANLHFNKSEIKSFQLLVAVQNGNIEVMNNEDVRLFYNWVSKSHLDLELSINNHNKILNKI